MGTHARAVIVATTRTGSSWLASLLDSHPDMRFHGEIFNLEAAGRDAVREPKKYLDERLSCHPEHHVVGFKMLYHQARLEYLNDFLAEMDQGRASLVDWRLLFRQRPVTCDHAPALETTWDALRDDGQTNVIHLKRRNLLRRYVSHEILMASSQARWRGEDHGTPPGVSVDPQALLRSFEDSLREQQEIARFFQGNPLIDVTYEDLVLDEMRERLRVLAFLGVRDHPLCTPHRRAEPRSLAESVKNYDELKAVLGRTRWACFLSED